MRTAWAQVGYTDSLMLASAPTGTAMLGHTEHAITAAKLTYTEPAGWANLGAGSYRAAWLGPDGVVYKVPCISQDWDMNQEELIRWAMLLTHAEYRQFVPPHRGIDIGGNRLVVAMAPIKHGPRLGWPEREATLDAARTAARHAGITDVAKSDNVVATADRRVYIRDAGNGSSPLTSSCASCASVAS